MSVLSVADMLIGVFLGMFLPIGYFAQKSVMRIASDLSFVEGAVIFLAGALLAFFRSTLTSPVKVLIIAGAAMIGLSVVFGMLS